MRGCRWWRIFDTVVVGDENSPLGIIKALAALGSTVGQPPLLHLLFCLIAT